MERPAARLVLIDPWLSDAGGHNLQYALDVGASAQQHGYDIVLAVHRDLPDTVRFKATWRVLRLYRYASCGRHWLGPVGRSSQPSDLDGMPLSPAAVPQAGKARTAFVYCRQWIRNICDWPAARDRRRRIIDFAASSSRLLDQIAPHAGDLFFLPSMSEFDFLGVARFLRDDSRTREFDWHLQFHFNVFVGRDAEYAQQTDRLERFERQLGGAIRQIPHHRLHFYATTAAMARQFDHVGIGRFQPLPYPVRDLNRDDPRPAATGLSLQRATARLPSSAALPGFNGSRTAHDPSPVELPRSSRLASTASRAAHTVGPASPCTGTGIDINVRPLRVTFAGAMRREKGKKKLGSLIATVWDDCLANGRMQFVFQASQAQLAHWLPRKLRRVAAIAPAGGKEATAPLLTAPYPLDAEAYTQLIQLTDLGVFLYDARRYYARASGILCEMLAAAVPVMVPAGCWLADQISQAGFDYADELARRDTVLGTWEFALHPATSGAGWSAWAEGTLPSSTCDVVVQWNWPPNWPSGVCARLTAEFGPAVAPSRNPLAERIVGRPELDDGPLPEAAEAIPCAAGVVFSVPPWARTLRLRVQSAYSAESLDLGALRVTALPAPATGRQRPISCVGLVAAGDEQIPGLIREMLAHYPHYRATARAFAQGWLQRHHADRTIEILRRHAARGLALSSSMHPRPANGEGPCIDLPATPLPLVTRSILTR